MVKTRNAYKILFAKPEGKRQLGRARSREILKTNNVSKFRLTDPCWLFLRHHTKINTDEGTAEGWNVVATKRTLVKKKQMEAAISVYFKSNYYHYYYYYYVTFL
jgi:hypothetical protein